MRASVGLIIATTILAGCAAPPPQPARFTLDPDAGIVVDNQSGLIWTACPAGQHLSGDQCTGEAVLGNRDDHVRNARHNRLLSHEDWRLPTVHELLSLVDCGPKGKVNSEVRLGEWVCDDNSERGVLNAAFPASIEGGNYIVGERLVNDEAVAKVAYFNYGNLGGFWPLKTPYARHKALYVRGQSFAPPKAIEEAVAAPHDPLEGKKVVVDSSTRYLCTDAVLEEPQPSGSALRDDDAPREYQLLYRVRSQSKVGHDLPFHYFKASSADGQTVYLNSGLVEDAFEKLEAGYTHWDFTGNFRSCLYALDLMEYSKRLDRIEADRQRQDREARAAAQAKAEEERSRSEAYSQMLKRPSPTIGMTQLQVRNETNWGPPDDIRRTTTANGSYEVWTYGSGSLMRHLHFSNGILEIIQD